MNSINFGSRLKPVTKPEYNKALQAFTEDCASVYPWTTRQAVYKNRVYTGGIRDCTACIIKDYDKALLLHLCPDMEENKNFEKISNFIKQKVDVYKNNLEAFLTGSNPESESVMLYNKLRDFLKKYNIPTTELQQALDSVSILYRSDKDELILSVGNVSDVVKSFKDKGQSDIEILNHCFNKVSIANCDEVEL